MYADDVTIWTQGRQIAGLFAGIQQALIGVGDWARNKGFLFSAEKSNAVLFRRSLRRVDVGTFPTLVIQRMALLKCVCQGRILAQIAPY